MKKITTLTAASALALASGVATAQESTADFYGFVIAGINDGSTTDADTVGARGDGNGPSRFGFIGTHELADGMAGGVQLEYGVNAPRAQGDAPALRQANVYLTGDFGRVELGNQDNPMYEWTTSVTDLFLTEAYAQGRASDVVFRQDGAFFYTTPSLNGLEVRVGGNMQSGEDADGNRGSGFDSYTVSAKYNFGDIYASASYLNVDGGDTNPDAKSVGLSLSYDYGMGTIAAATTRNDNVDDTSTGSSDENQGNQVSAFYTDPDGNPYEITGTYNATDAVTLKASFADADRTGGDSKSVAVEAAYAFSSNVAAAIGYTSPDDNFNGDGDSDNMAAAAVYVSF